MDAAACPDADLGRVGDDELMAQMVALGRRQRELDRELVLTVGEIARRSASRVVAEKMTSRYGCHDLNELVQRTTLVSPVTAARMIRAAKAVCGERALVSGEELEPAFPALREAMTMGAVGVDGLLAATGDVIGAGRRVSPAQRRIADAALAQAAMGTRPDGAPPACADLLRVAGRAWACAFDQDGPEPADRIAAHRRALVFGAPTATGVPFRGVLTHDVHGRFTHRRPATTSPTRLCNAVARTWTDGRRQSSSTPTRSPNSSPAGRKPTFR